MNLKIALLRYHPEKKPKPQYDHFLVHYKKGMTVLDVLQYIYQKLDSTLAYRFECRQGICGTCAVTLDGKPVLSCSTQLKYKKTDYLIEPLANFPVEKDLIVDLKPVLARYVKIQPYLQKTKKVLLTRKRANQSKPFRKCIECGCCIAGSLVKQKSVKEVIDPMALVKLARYFTDPRDGINRKKTARESGVNSYSISEGKRLSRICPRNIPIDTAIKLLK